MPDLICSEAGSVARSLSGHSTCDMRACHGHSALCENSSLQQRSLQNNTISKMSRKVRVIHPTPNIKEGVAYWKDQVPATVDGVLGG